MHNLEHGYTILWYDETIADDADEMNELRAIAESSPTTSNFRNKFIAAPWTQTTARRSPTASTSRSRTGRPAATATTTRKQVGVWQYCSAVSGEALDFMVKYPYADSPEPDAM